MRVRLPRFRSQVAGGLILAASTALLAVGLFSIIAALSGQDVDLPEEGSLEDILRDRSVREEGRSTDINGSVEPLGEPPVRLLIPGLQIDAPVIAMGLDSNRHPEVPDDGYVVAWYTFSAAPGRGSNAVFSGHYDWYTPAGEPLPGIFYRLRELTIGDEIMVTLDDGTEMRYRVTGNVSVPYEDPNVVKVMEPTTKDAITVVTCGGTWVRDGSYRYGGNYSHRIIVRAERVLEPSVEGETGSTLARQGVSESNLPVAR